MTALPIAMTKQLVQKRDAALLEVLDALCFTLENDLLGARPREARLLRRFEQMRCSDVTVGRSDGRLKIRLSTKRRRPRLGDLELEGEASKALLSFLEARRWSSDSPKPLWPSRRIGRSLRANSMQRIVRRQRMAKA